MKGGKVRLDWYKITNFLKLFSRPLHVKIIATLGNKSPSRNLTISRISEEVRDQEKKVFRYCKNLLEQGFLKCTNNALLEGEKGYVKRQGKVPKFELTAKGIAINRLFQFILNYESQEDVKLLEKQLQVGRVLGEIEEDLTKILENVKKIREDDEDSGDE